MTAQPLDEALQDIKARQDELAKLIARIEERALHVPPDPILVTMPKLSRGERWVGCVLAGDKREHTILLPGDAEPATWKDQVKWASSIGGHLPDRVEQVLLFRFLQGEFKEAAYWSGEVHALDSVYAWGQNFFTGCQDSWGKYTKLRARAVRRIVIER